MGVWCSAETERGMTEDTTQLFNPTSQSTLSRKLRAEGSNSRYEADSFEGQINESKFK